MEITMKHKAWMGGSGPKPIHLISIEELNYVALLYNEQRNTFIEFWKEKPDSWTDEIFWNRARCDAHATFRD